MPFCIHCGDQISEEARFCPACGKPVTQGNPAQETGPVEELTLSCDQSSGSMGEAFRLSMDNSRKFILRGHVTTARGLEELFNVSFWAQTDESPERFSGIGRSQAQAVLDELHEQLVDDGWSLVSRGTWWYSRTYKRGHVQVDAAATTGKLSVRRINQNDGRFTRMGLLVDGQKVYSIPNGERYEMELGPGKHTIQVEQSGFKSNEVVMDISPGATFVLNVGYVANFPFDKIVLRRPDEPGKPYK